MAQVRLGMVGLGSFAQLHLECLQQMPRVKVTAVCDIRPEVVEQTIQKWGCNGYTDLAEMLEKESLDALDILTPEYLHYEPVLAGLKAGCHVFVEKPLEIHLEKASEMINASLENDKLLMIGHVTRFDPRYIQMKQSVERGDIGRIRSIYARRSDKREYFPIYRRTPTLFVLGVHDIDQILWYMNTLPQEVYAKKSSSEEGEDLVCIMMTFPDGTIAMIESSWLTPKSWPAPQDQYTQIMGDSGVLRMQSPDQSFSISTEQYYEIPHMYGNRNIHGRIEGPLMAELTHFVDCIDSGKTSLVLPPEDALNVIRVANAVVRSYELNQPVLLSQVL